MSDGKLNTTKKCNATPHSTGHGKQRKCCANSFAVTFLFSFSAVTFVLPLFSRIRIFVLILRCVRYMCVCVFLAWWWRTFVFWCMVYAVRRTQTAIVEFLKWFWARGETTRDKRLNQAHHECVHRTHTHTPRHRHAAPRWRLDYMPLVARLREHFEKLSMHYCTAASPL